MSVPFAVSNRKVTLLYNNVLISGGPDVLSPSSNLGDEDIHVSTECPASSKIDFIF
jgi:hypothetical protein